MAPELRPVSVSSVFLSAGRRTRPGDAVRAEHPGTSVANAQPTVFPRDDVDEGMAPMTGDTPFPWRRALVTGGAGFLGSHLCENLLASGIEVDCADNLACG